MYIRILIFIWQAVQLAIGYNLVFPLLLYFLYPAARNKFRLNKVWNRVTEADYGIIVTAYQQTDALPNVIESLLKQEYTNFMIYIVADQCDISQLNFDHPQVIVLRPEKPLKSNIRSHFYAIKRFVRPHPRLTIIDSDNLAHPKYLSEMNVCFTNGYQAVQGLRAAKNLNTTYACLDAARDIYYHFYDGELLFKAGSSATLAGSGMAFTTELYRFCLENLDISGAGFDKVLQAEIVNYRLQISFAHKAIVYDEKTMHPQQLVNQRTRWIRAWFRYAGFGFKLIFRGLGNLSKNQVLFGLVLLRPPLFIFLILSGICTIANLWVHPAYTWFWLAGYASFIVSFFIALYQSKADHRIYKALYGIPKFMFYQVLSLLRISKTEGGSVATEHYYQADIKKVMQEKI
ncbi:glycosyltransferase [Mucilaginibacter arboris]|uniref:Glycosyltransferase n=1 Tax=Mucilaginibacter arboris TaxID=2682090 RepID=A0A7K1T0Y9_9SPHI|nr:glycosyltransferase [Mucilaginibacter arboris]MVN22950.1 glycosyltransferase [Mucilaginibacter arboris]